MLPGFVYFTSYTLFASRHFPSLPHAGSCQGGETAALVGVAILTSYLFLFVAFYLATYRGARQPGRSAARKASDLRRLGSKTSGALQGGLKLMPVVKE